MTTLGTVPAGAFTRCAWCCGSLPTPCDRNLFEVEAGSYRTGRLGPRRQRYLARWTAGHYAACDVCAPLVFNRDVSGLVDRAESMQGAQIGGVRFALLPRPEALALIRAVDRSTAAALSPPATVGH